LTKSQLFVNYQRYQCCLITTHIHTHKKCAVLSLTGRLGIPQTQIRKVSFFGVLFGVCLLHGLFVLYHILFGYRFPAVWYCAHLHFPFNKIQFHVLKTLSIGNERPYWQRISSCLVVYYRWIDSGYFCFVFCCSLCNSVICSHQVTHNGTTFGVDFYNPPIETDKKVAKAKSTKRSRDETKKVCCCSMCIHL
jgi:hypothetical protein